MKKFLVTYHAPADAMAQTAGASQEDMAKGMQAWMDWAQKCGEQLVDLGAPLFNGYALHTDGTSAPSEKQISGYSILQAENMDEAKSLLEGHPHLNGWNKDCSIEVHESMPVPGMEQAAQAAGHATAEAETAAQ